jgi:AcrR family transcriptional regulator
LTERQLRGTLGDVTVTEADQRGRILDAALALLADHGSAGMSMRRLATACDLNVATLYHYFPSKQALVRAAVARGALERLDAPAGPVAPAGAPVEERLAALLARLAQEMFADDARWRVLIAEALRGDDDVLPTLLAVSDAFDAALARWLAELLPDAPGLHAPEVVTALREALYGLLILRLVQPEGREHAVARATADLAAVFARIGAAPPVGTTTPPAAPPR